MKIAVKWTNNRMTDVKVSMYHINHLFGNMYVRCSLTPVYFKD